MRRTRPVLLSVSLVGLSLLWGAKKVFDYSAAPDGDKQSDFDFPPNAEQEKAIVLGAEAQPSGFEFSQRGGFTNDASHLNLTAVYGIVRPKSEEEITIGTIHKDAVTARFLRRKKTCSVLCCIST